MSDQFEGSCLCGAVRFVATGQPASVVWCHCESCHKHSGAPVSVFVAFQRNAYVVIEGQITKFNSSPGRWRGFCAKCGSTLTCEGERSNETHVQWAAPFNRKVRTPSVNRYAGPQVTLGNAAVARVRLIVWCKGLRSSGRARPRRNGRTLRCRDYGAGVARAAATLGESLPYSLDVDNDGVESLPFGHFETHCVGHIQHAPPCPHLRECSARYPL
jgi:hypothetical protein